MPADAKTGDPLDMRRRRARYRAWHRGTKEMDIIMGRFVDAEIDIMSTEELDQFERLIDVGDPELFSWIVQGVEAEKEHQTPLLARLKAFHLG